MKPHGVTPSQKRGGAGGGRTPSFVTADGAAAELWHPHLPPVIPNPRAPLFSQQSFADPRCREGNVPHCFLQLPARGSYSAQSQRCTPPHCCPSPPYCTSASLPFGLRSSPLCLPSSASLQPPKPLLRLPAVPAPQPEVGARRGSHRGAPTPSSPPPRFPIPAAESRGRAKTALRLTQSAFTAAHPPVQRDGGGATGKRRAAMGDGSAELQCNDGSSAGCSRGEGRCCGVG